MKEPGMLYDAKHFDMAQTWNGGAREKWRYMKLDRV